jgi:hypothetical protein
MGRISRFISSRDAFAYSRFLSYSSYVSLLSELIDVATASNDWMPAFPYSYQEDYVSLREAALAAKHTEQQRRASDAAAAAAAECPYAPFGHLPLDIWYHLIAHYLTIKELRTMVRVHPAFVTIAQAAYASKSYRRPHLRAMRHRETCLRA